MSKRATGDSYEARAASFLKQNGLRVLASNVNSPFGEIDIVALSGKVLVFVEVRYRQHSRFGGAAVSITSAKRNRIIATAEWFLQQNSQYRQAACRFDVIAFEEQQLNWIKQAFDAG